MSSSSTGPSKSPVFIFILLGLIMAGFAVIAQTPIWDALTETPTSGTRGGKVLAFLEGLDPLLATLILAALAAVMFGIALFSFLRNRKLKQQA